MKLLSTEVHAFSEIYLLFDLTQNVDIQYALKTSISWLYNLVLSVQGLSASQNVYVNL